MTKTDREPPQNEATCSTAQGKKTVKERTEESIGFLCYFRTQEGEGKIYHNGNYIDMD